MYKLIFVLLLSIVANATTLNLVNGKIQAHTEVFGDSTINPETEKIVTHLAMADSIESISGEFEIEAISLVSDNKDRDKHMYEILHIIESPKISFVVSSISKNEETYIVKGDLTMNGVTKHISSQASIVEKNMFLDLNGNFSIKLTDFNLEPPTMFFLTVRDLIDIKYSFHFEEK
ncbi:YceI family protein [Campylobacterota bacterium DY0563]